MLTSPLLLQSFPILYRLPFFLFSFPGIFQPICFLKWHFFRMIKTPKETANKGAYHSPHHRVYTTPQLALLVGLVHLTLAILPGCSGGTSSEGNLPGGPLASTCGPPSSSGLPPTNSLISPRASHTATLLPNGTVLVAGGSGSTGASHLG